MATSQSAPQRGCIACGQTDDHPRHVITLPDGSSVAFHMDCHALTDPPCEVCAQQTAGAEGMKGAELRAHLTGEGAV